ncbi:MAG: glycosyltransferase family 2 protein, partial [Rubrobacteraceae bacterium]
GWLEGALDSVVGQVYPNWELCVRDDASTRVHVRETLSRYGRLDGRIKISHGRKNLGICGASNAALSTATGEFVALLDHDDELAPDALFEVVKLLQEHPESDLIYTDEDMMDEAGNRFGPRFKPDWSPEMLLALNYVIHLSVYRRSLLEEISGFRKGFEGSQDYDLVLRFTEKTDKIFHIPKILYHWKAVTGSVAADPESKPHTHERTRRALEEALARRDLGGSVEDEFYHSVFRARLKVNGDPKVSIIISTEGNPASLKRCIESIEALTTYGNYEVLVLDTGATDPARLEYLDSIPHRVIPFVENHSGTVNLAAHNAEGDHLLFLEDAVEIMSGGWTEAMLEHAPRSEIGAVGARLRYPDSDGRLCHAGVILGAGDPQGPGVADHAHRFYPAAYPGYLGATLLPRNFSAVSGACVMIRKEVFDETGGFDEKNLPHAYNDVDLCLRLGELGYRIVYTPYAELRYHGPVARRSSPDEYRYMRKRWREVLDNDPYYNPNFSLADGSYNLRADALRSVVLRDDETNARSSRPKLPPERPAPPAREAYLIACT